MSQRIIKKALIELSEEEPDISYVRGLLEGIVDDTSPINTFVSPVRTPDRLNPPLGHIDEEIIPEHVKAGPIAKLG